MGVAPLADTHFFLSGEAAAVSNALGNYLARQGADVSQLSRVTDLKASDEQDNVLVVHLGADSALAHKLGEIKKLNPTLRVMLLHEFTDRGGIGADVLAFTDQLLEKPFTTAHLEKALSRLRFHPLAGRIIYLGTADNYGDLSLLTRLGAQVLRELPEVTAKVSVELGVFSPDALGSEFRSALKSFRAQFPDVPVFLLYDPQVPGVLDAEILNEVAYLVQRPVRRDVLRQKLIAYFEQPQQDRRKNPRKQGISQLWISSYNEELGTTELFESPFLVDISRSGLSFMSRVEYPENQMMAIWVVSEDYPDKILDLRGHIRWQRRETAADGAQLFKYGVEFAAQESEAFLSFARMIAMHSG